MSSRFLALGGCLTALSLVWGGIAQAQTLTLTNEDDITILERLVVQAASEELKQALGVSTITSEDLSNKPTGRDLSEIIRTMPGVNLTGNSATGQRGNNRQIDIRGMGPENTLILIDGKPVLSRNSVRMGRQGERDTRGDSSWVPPEMIERIEVIRGPAAARYGSGASGGVVNIITKRPEKTTITVSSYLQVPEHQEEGGTRRANIMVGGPINDIFSYRLMASGSWTDGDAPDINDAAAVAAGKTTAPAGREGVISYDVKGLWSAQINPDHRVDLEATYSRQGNVYAGDRLLSGTPSATITGLAAAGAETNVMQRATLSATHFGTYDFGESESYIQWEHSVNRRLSEGTAGGGEGAINSTTKFNTITLNNLIAKSEWDIPVTMIWDQTITLGAEYRGEFMNDPTVNQQSNFTSASPGLGVELSAAARNPNVSAQMGAVYIEDNILMTDQLTVTPALRADLHEGFGLNFSPSLNASYALTDEITIKGGIARAFKAPNLFQLNPNYFWNSGGNGCPPGLGPCAVLGDPNLNAEISVNKEIGIAYANADGWAASLTYFHNDYQNKIQAGTTKLGTLNGTTNVFRWENSGPAVVSGLEGNLTVPLHEQLLWTTNFTKMIESKELTNGQPLSLVPEYTINTALRWEAMEDLGLTLSATHYGKVKPRTLNAKGVASTTPSDYETRDPYTLFNFALDYAPSEQLKITAGINNLLDERLFRTGNGANTYNEPGRSYYLSLTGSF